MAVLIDGMEMPKEGFIEILIRDDGTVQQTGQSYRIDGTDYYTPYVGEMPAMYKAAPVPPHGLIDRERILDSIRIELAQVNAVNDMEDYDSWMRVFDYVRKFPTIIPASEEGEA